jgi:hypothetical protein
MTTNQKNGAAAPRDPDLGKPDSLPTEIQIRRFVNGETTGRDVLGALYDHILDEPVPQRLKDLLRK